MGVGCSALLGGGSLTSAPMKVVTTLCWELKLGEHRVQEHKKYSARSGLDDWLAELLLEGLESVPEEDWPALWLRLHLYDGTPNGRLNGWQRRRSNDLVVRGGDSDTVAFVEGTE